jgi:hypothetical protein
MHAIGSSLPADVLVHHIFPSLSDCSIICASMVCKTWRKLIPREKRNHPASALTLLFRVGAPLKLTQWFTDSLGFPVWNFTEEYERDFEERLSLAANGNSCDEISFKNTDKINHRRLLAPSTTRTLDRISD